MTMEVIDEKGQPYDTVHGVSVHAWLGVIGDVIGDMRNPKKIWRLGLAKLPDDERNQHTCHDPDCARLNRTDEAIGAKYILEKDAPAVKYVPESDPERDAKERKIAEGHPTKAGSYLCELCARVAFAKRIVDVKGGRNGSAKTDNQPKTAANAAGDRGGEASG